MAALLALAAPAALAAGATRDACFTDESKPDEMIAGCNLVLSQRKRETTTSVVNAYFNRGLAYANKEDYERAIADFSESIRLDPSNVDAIRKRGESYESLEQYDRALKDLDQAVRLDPKDARNFAARGTTYRSTGAYEKSLKDYDDALRLDAKGSWIHYGRALTFEKNDQPDKALLDLEAAARLDPDDADIQQVMKRVRAVVMANTPSAAPAAAQAGPATVAELDAQESAVAATWARLPFGVRTSTLIAGSSGGFGIYEARSSNVYKPGEEILVYLEPIGYTWAPRDGGTYGIGIVMDFELVTKSGEILAGQKAFMEQAFVSHHRNREFSLTFTGTFKGLTAGDYTLALVLHDKGSSRTTRVEKAFVIKE
ncbi:tetratricopeptide repeat protein [Methylobacterium sp. A54F]